MNADDQEGKGRVREGRRANGCARGGPAARQPSTPHQQHTRTRNPRARMKSAARQNGQASSRYRLPGLTRRCGRQAGGGGGRRGYEREWEVFFFFSVGH